MVDASGEWNQARIDLRQFLINKLQERTLSRDTFGQIESGRNAPNRGIGSCRAARLLERRASAGD
jgi:hypothetical protein